MLRVKRRPIIISAVEVLAVLIGYVIWYHFFIGNLLIGYSYGESELEREQFSDTMADLSIVFNVDFQYLIVSLVSLFLIYNVYAYYYTTESPVELEKYKQKLVHQQKIGHERRTWRGVGNIFTASKFLYLILLFMLLVGLVYLYFR
jgi:hypothetical protein